LAEAQRLSHTGSWVFNVAIRGVVHSSEEHRRLFGFDPKEGMPVWDDWVRRIHPEDRERMMDTMEQSIREGTNFELDYRTAHPDGTIKYIHAVGHPVLNASGDLVEFMGASIDMTDRKRAEAEARESERRYREAQAELAHVTRVTTLGELTASIAHEVNQPLAAVLANAEACLHWLDRESPDLDGARRSVEWIIKDGKRAGEVIQRVRGILKKSDTQKAPLDVNDVVNDAVALGAARTAPPPRVAADGARAGFTRGPRRSGPAAAGDHQSRDQRHPSDANGHGSAARTDNPNTSERPDSDHGEGLRCRILRRKGGSAVHRLLHH
jgi:PAS domain S-box-containing protein